MSANPTIFEWFRRVNHPELREQLLRLTQRSGWNDNGPTHSLSTALNDAFDWVDCGEKPVAFARDWSTLYDLFGEHPERYLDDPEPICMRRRVLADVRKSLDRKSVV
jgi:hypothetical protein